MEKVAVITAIVCCSALSAELAYFYGNTAGEDAAEARYKASTRVECEQLPGEAEQCTKHREYYEGAGP